MFDTVLNWLNTPAFTSFDAPTTWAEVLGFAAGALCVYLVVIQNIWNWPTGIANNILWIALFASAGLYADSALQVVYIALSLWGWHMWLRGGVNRTERVVSNTTGTQWAALLLAGSSGTVFLTWFLATYTNSTVPFWDALTTALSLMATAGQSFKWVQSWVLWATADLIYMPVLVSKGLTLTAILYAGFFALCVKGYLAWRADLHQQTTLIDPPCHEVAAA